MILPLDGKVSVNTGSLLVVGFLVLLLRFNSPIILPLYGEGSGSSGINTAGFDTSSGIVAGV